MDDLLDCWVYDREAEGAYYPYLYESVVSIIVLMLWIVDVRSKMDVILLLKPISNLYARKYATVVELWKSIIRILKGNLNLKLIKVFHLISILIYRVLI